MLPLVCAGCVGVSTAGSGVTGRPAPSPVSTVEPTPLGPGPEPVDTTRSVSLAKDPCSFDEVGLRAIPASCRCALRPREEGPPERVACTQTAREAGWRQLRVAHFANPSKRGDPIDVTVVLENTGATPAALHFDEEHGAWRPLHPGLVKATDEHDQRVDVPKGSCSGGSLPVAPKPHSAGVFVRTSLVAVVLQPGGKVVFEAQWSARERIFRRDGSGSGRAAEVARDLDPCGVIDGAALDPGHYHLAYDLGLIAPTSDGLHRVLVEAEVK